jgi:RecJ-like exonuclease
MNTHLASPPEDLAESAAGEEDPGSAIDLAVAAADLPGAGEDICPDCGGTGQLAGLDCPTCQGTGKMTAGLGGA